MTRIIKNLRLKNQFGRYLLGFLAGIALNGSAQQFLQSNDDSMNHPWRLERISPDDDWTRHFRIGGFAGFNIKADFKMTGRFATSGGSPGLYDDGYVLAGSTGNPYPPAYLGD